MTQPIQTGEQVPLRMAVTLRKPLPEQQAEKRQLMHGPRSIAYVLIFGAAIYFALAGTMAVYAFSTDPAGRAPVLFGLFFGAGLCILAQILQNRRVFLKDEKNYRRSLYDEPAEKLLEVYDDRLEVILPYGTSVYPFCRVKRMLCTHTMMVVCVEQDELVIRAEDLTSEEAGLLFSHMVHRLPLDKVRVYHPLRGVAYQSLPLPPQRPLPHAKFVARTRYRAPQKENYLRALPFLVGSSLLVSSLLTGMQLFSGDAVTLFWWQTVIGLAIQSVAWLLFCLPDVFKSPKEIFIVMLDDGLITVEQGITRCYKQNHVSVRQKQAGLDIRFADKQVFVRWQDMSDAVTSQTS